MPLDVAVLDDPERPRPTRTRRVVMAIGAVVVVLVIGLMMVINPTGSPAPTPLSASVVPPFSNWVSFTAPDGRFSASFPAWPDHTSRPGPTGGPPTETFGWASGGGLELNIAYVDYPVGSVVTSSPETSFANMERGMTDGGWNVSASRDLDGSYPGHEFTMSKGDFRTTFQVWIAGNRFYEVGVRGDSPDTVAFLDSFQITAE